MNITPVLLIPSAKIVPEELQAIGKLPAIIYPVNDGIVFDYLYKQYKDAVADVDVVCCENIHKVRRRLSAYINERIRIGELPEVKDLGHTVYYGLGNEHVPVIINFGDTIVFENIYEYEGDSFFYSEDYISEVWTFFEMENGVLTDILDKTCTKEKGTIKGRLFVGVFQLSDGADFKLCLEKAFECEDLQIDSFYYALRLYSKRHSMQAIITEEWFDIGHIEKYYSSKLEVEARAFNHIVIDRNRGVLKKTSNNKEKFIDEIRWYLKLPSDLEYVRPRVFDYSTAYSDPYVSMEYYAYHTIHELYVYADLNCHQWAEVFKKIRYILNDFSRYTVADESIIPSLEEMYLNKTLVRLEELKKSVSFINFFYKPITINGKKYQSLETITKKLGAIIPELLYNIRTFCVIHGDMCFANMMIDSNLSFIKVIDPRGKFGKYDIFGDPRYELAKILHSIDGMYDFIIKDLYQLEYDVNNSCIEYKILEREREYSLMNIFFEIFEKEINENVKEIELIEALLFLSMIPLHQDSVERQMVMLGTGVEILNRVIDVTL